MTELKPTAKSIKIIWANYYAMKDYQPFFIVDEPHSLWTYSHRRLLDKCKFLNMHCRNLDPKRQIWKPVV